MTAVLLAAIALFAALVLAGVLWSLIGAIRAESAGARLRREGVQATGTVIDNTMTSTPQRRLIFHPVVEFHCVDGSVISAPARQSAATSWPRGASVQVAYDPAEPTRFVLAGSPERPGLVASTLVGLVVVLFMIGTMAVTFGLWEQFRHDRGTPTEPASSSRTTRGSAGGTTEGSPDGAVGQ